MSEWPAIGALDDQLAHRLNLAARCVGAIRSEVRTRHVDLIDEVVSRTERWVRFQASNVRLSLLLDSTRGLLLLQSMPRIDQRWVADIIDAVGWRRGNWGGAAPRQFVFVEHAEIAELGDPRVDRTYWRTFRTNYGAQVASPDLLADLELLLLHQAAPVRSFAADAIACMALDHKVEPKLLLRLLSMARDDHDEGVRDDAMSAAADLLPSRWTPSLLAAIRTLLGPDTPEMLAVSAMRAVGNYGARAATASNLVGLLAALEREWVWRENAAQGALAIARGGARWRVVGSTVFRSCVRSLARGVKPVAALVRIPGTTAIADVRVPVG